MHWLKSERENLRLSEAGISKEVSIFSSLDHFIQAIPLYTVNQNKVFWMTHPILKSNKKRKIDNIEWLKRRIEF